jgi:LysM repeat protein
MGERWRMAYIALTAVVVALAVASAILSVGRPAPLPTDALYTPIATSAPSPIATVTLQLPTLTAATPTSTPVAMATLRPSPSPSPTFTPYVVQAGQTLGAIARKFGVTVQAVLAANPDITDPDFLTAGQVILIPPPGWGPGPSPTPSPSST